MSGEVVIASEAYARWRATTLGRITERVESGLVLSLAGPLANRRVLDVGTGDGTYAIEAAERGALATGLDSQSELLNAARARAARRGLSIEFREGRAESLPFDDARFDVVLAVTVLCFVAKPEAVVREMARVLASGGRLVLGELGRRSVWAAERRVRGWLGAKTWQRAHFWSPRELVGLVNGAGLHAGGVRGSVFFPPSGIAARAVAPPEPILSHFHLPGAAFLALAADKPGSRP